MVCWHQSLLLFPYCTSCMYYCNWNQLYICLHRNNLYQFIHKNSDAMIWKLHNCKICSTKWTKSIWHYNFRCYIKIHTQNGFKCHIKASHFSLNIKYICKYLSSTHQICIYSLGLCTLSALAPFWWAWWLMSTTKGLHPRIISNIH